MYHNACKIILLILIPLSVQARICPKEIKKLAEEMLYLELAGTRLAQKSDCLDSSAFKFITPYHYPQFENIKKHALQVTQKKHIRITKIAKQNELGEYKVYFRANALYRGRRKYYRDHFTFVAHQTKRKQQRNGCADLLIPPENMFVMKNCIPQKHK